MAVSFVLIRHCSRRSTARPSSARLVSPIDGGQFAPLLGALLCRLCSRVLLARFSASSRSFSVRGACAQGQRPISSPGAGSASPRVSNRAVWSYVVYMVISCITRRAEVPGDVSIVKRTARYPQRDIHRTNNPIRRLVIHHDGDHQPLWRIWRCSPLKQGQTTRNATRHRHHFESVQPRRRAA